MKLRMLFAEAVSQLRSSGIENAVRDARALENLLCFRLA